MPKADLNTIADLNAHMEWADSRVWASIPNLQDQNADPDLHQLLFHLHFTQLAFLTVWRQEPFVMRKAEEFQNLAEIRSVAKEFYPGVRAVVASVTEDEASRPLLIPWAKYFARQLATEIQPTTLGETMLQVAMHSQYHRAQVNRRLRELGLEPPMVDYIAWLWSGRPGPVA